MRNKSTKRALLSSALALLLCFSMLVGTTFAWFTDSVTSANNIIKSGNLDITLEYYDGGWKDVKDSSTILDANALWEPGYTEVAYFRIKNAGSLALKYQFGVNIISETEGKNAEDQPFKLSDYIYFDVFENVNGETGAFADRDAAMENTTETTLISAGYSKAGTLAAGSEYVHLAMVIYMPENVGNVANHNGTDIPQIELGINVVATQMEAENDAFGTDYDGEAELPEINSAVIPENSATDTVIKPSAASEVSVTVPAGAPAGTYTLEVSNQTVTTDEAGNTTAAFDIELLKDGAEAPDGSYTVAINVGAGLNITAVTHSGTAVTDYNYDINTGIITFTTISFSPFAVTYYGNIEEDATAEDIAALIARGGNFILHGDLALTETIVIPEGTKVTLDLNGYNITVPETTDRHMYALNNKGELTLKDSKGTGSVSARGIYNGYNGSNTEETVAGAKMIVESGNYIALDTDGGAAIFNCAELVINGGTFSGGAAAVNTRKMGVATINGGTYTGNSSNSYRIQNNGGNVTVNNASVTGGFGAIGCFGGLTVINNGTYLPTGRKVSTCHVVYVAANATVVINDGKFMMNYPADAIPDSGSAVASYYNGNLTINGGEFTSHFDNVSPVELSTGSTIKGGTYLTHSGEASEHVYITNFLHADYKLVDGTVYYKYASRIGEQGYDTLDEAIKAAKEGDTVVITASIDGATVKLPATLKNVTFTAAKGVVLHNSTIMASDGNSICYEGITFKNIVFENSRISITGWRNDGAIVNDLTVTECVFKNINDTTNSAALHINIAEHEAVNGLTFTNNVIDGATGGSKSGVYAQVTGKTTFTGNVINNVSFRPYVIQVTVNDGIDDEFIVTGNTFSNSAAGRAQGLGNDSTGTDNVKLVVSNNIFKGITSAQQICYWNFNSETTTADLSYNYYDIDVASNPSRFYYNSSASSVEDLVNFGIYPYYTELNEDGTINTDSLVTAP